MKSSKRSSSKGRRSIESSIEDAVTFLSKRDGIDKLLKAAKYVTSLGIALDLDQLNNTIQNQKSASLEEKGGRGPGKLDKLEAALSLSRKAFRLGKFLGNLKKCLAILERAREGREKSQQERDATKDGGFVERQTDQRALLMLSVIFNCSEGLYYFLDQIQVRFSPLPHPRYRDDIRTPSFDSTLNLFGLFDFFLFNCLPQQHNQFLVKAKVLKKTSSVKRMKKVATYAEILSYLSDSLQSMIHLRSKATFLQENKDKLDEKKEHKQKVESEIFEFKVVLMQNCADFFCALNDLRESNTYLGDPTFLAACGILSAVIGIRSKWKK